MGGNYYLPLNGEYNGFRFIDDNSYMEIKVLNVLTD